MFPGQIIFRPVYTYKKTTKKHKKQGFRCFAGSEAIIDRNEIPQVLHCLSMEGLIQRGKMNIE